MAVDVQAQALTEGFVPPTSDDMQMALNRLQRRVPLGATNLDLGLKTALKMFEGNAARGIIYIGDGMSTANLIHSDDLRALVAVLRKEHVPVHSYAVGPRTDMQLLGILAAQTGGVVLVDQGRTIWRSREKGGTGIVVCGGSPGALPVGGRKWSRRSLIFCRRTCPHSR